MTACTVQFLNPTEIMVTGPEALPTWRKQNRVPVPGAQYTPQYKHNKWDGLYAPGKWCRTRGHGLFDFRGSRGLLSRMQAGGLQLDLSHQADFRARIETRFNEWWANKTVPENFRDYQIEAIRLGILQQWGRFALATNAGKGAIIAWQADFVAKQKLGVVILCDEVEVFQALTKEIKLALKYEPGIVEAGVQTPPDDYIVVAMVKTLIRRLEDKEGREITCRTWREWMASRSMVLLDEADKANAATWRGVLSYATGSHWRLGFSGSFPKADEEPHADLRLEESMGPILKRIQNQELIKRGISAQAEIVLYPFDVTDKVSPKLTADWWELSGAERRRWVYEQAIMDNTERHLFIRDLVPDEPTVIIVDRIEQGKSLAQWIPGSIFLEGANSKTERDTVLDRFLHGDIQTLIVTKILDRGSNRLGNAGTLIFASGEGSSTQILQRLGRGLRRANGKESVRVFDILDTVSFPARTDSSKRRTVAESIEEYLTSAIMQRLALYRDEGFAPEIVKLRR